jgi:NADH-quinone oxidoreductase subunit J
MNYLIFFLLSIGAIGGVIGMILSRNQAYNALFLVLSFASLGGVYALLNAPFIAVIQIIIYAGAILVLFLFVIMIVNLKKGIPPERKKWLPYIGVFLGVIFFIQISYPLILTFSFFQKSVGEQKSSPMDLGSTLFSEYLYPFEITSLLIITALIGAVVLLKRRNK